MKENALQPHGSLCHISNIPFEFQVIINKHSKAPFSSFVISACLDIEFGFDI